MNLLLVVAVVVQQAHRRDLRMALSSSVHHLSRRLTKMLVLAESPCTLLRINDDDDNDDDAYLVQCKAK